MTAYWAVYKFRGPHSGRYRNPEDRILGGIEIQRTAFWAGYMLMTKIFRSVSCFNFPTLLPSWVGNHATMFVLGSEAARQRGSAAAGQRGSGAAGQRGSGTARQRGCGAVGLRGCGAAGLRGYGAARLRVEHHRFALDIIDIREILDSLSISSYITSI